MNRIIQLYFVKYLTLTIEGETAEQGQGDTEKISHNYQQSNSNPVNLTFFNEVGGKEPFFSVQTTFPPSSILFGDEFNDIALLETQLVIASSFVIEQSLHRSQIFIASISFFGVQNLDIGGRKPTNLSLFALTLFEIGCLYFY